MKSFSQWRLTKWLLGIKGSEGDFKNIPVRVTNVERKDAPSVDRTLDFLDTKNAALLTHVSIMIAISGLLYTSAGQNVWFKLLYGLEILAYIFFACLCLCNLIPARGLDVPAAKADAGFRFALFDFTAKWTIRASISLAVLFVMKLITGAAS